MPGSRSRERSSSSELPKEKINIETPERSTTPDGDPPRRTLDFATGYKSSEVPRSRKDFASGYGLLQKDCNNLDNDGLQGKYRILEPPDSSYDCHGLTFHNGRHHNLSPEMLQDILDQFELLGSRDEFHDNPLLYDELTRKLNENKDSCIFLYFVNGENLAHSSPIEAVYEKENGERSIRLFGKLGQEGSLVTHDIEDIPLLYRDRRYGADWHIYSTNLKNGRIIDE